jgi:hypothetical protein
MAAVTGYSRVFAVMAALLAAALLLTPAAKPHAR